MRDYLKLAQPPKIFFRSPQCGTCVVDLECEDSWVCPSCGTSWGWHANDFDKGVLYEEWSGEELAGPVSDENEAFKQAWKKFRKKESQS